MLHHGTVVYVFFLECQGGVGNGQTHMVDQYLLDSHSRSCPHQSQTFLNSNMPRGQDHIESFHLLQNLFHFRNKDSLLIENPYFVFSDGLFIGVPQTLL